MGVDYTGMIEDLKGDLKKASDKNKRSEEQAKKTSELKRCAFCGGDCLYETFEVNDIGTTIPVIFCDSCKIIFKVENDSLYLEDDKTYEYLKEKNIKAWNKRKPFKRVIERLEERIRILDNTSDINYPSVDVAIKETKRIIEIIKEEMM